MRESIFADPPVTPFVECPNCKRLLTYGTERCPDCYEEISEDYARLSGAIVVINTKACAMANTIKTLDVTAVIALVVAAIEILQTPPTIPIIPFSWPAVALVAVILWFIRFGRFKLGDDDYVRARRQMSLRLLGWSLFGVGLWGFYFVVLRAYLGAR
jgi:RNA polymerase subunit RPABC4/transcription elongation factor Spt4